MKIALVSPYDYPYPGGVTNHISHLNEEFTRLGHAVTILAPSSLAERQVLTPHLVKMGSVVRVPANGSEARITLSLRLSGRVKRFLRVERFDVIHLHEPFMPVLPLTVLRHATTLTVGTFHSSWDGRVARLYGNPLLRRMAKRLNGRIAVSTRARDFVQSNFPGEYEIIPNGIAIDEFGANVKPFPELADGKISILFVGRLEQRKGFTYLLRAFGQLKAEFPNLRLIVVGAYSEKTGRRFDGFLRKSGILDVLMVGRASTADLPRFYRSCDIFCAPSTGGESQGIVLLEAMASGKPVVASSIEGYRSVLHHGQEGLLVPPKDPAALVTALRTLIVDPELRDQLGARGLETARQYSWSTIAERILAYYETLRVSAHGLRPELSGRRRIARYFRRLSTLFIPTAPAVS